MDVIALLTAEHDELARLFDELERDATPESLLRLTVLVKTHARTEEKVLYEVLRTTELRSFALEGPYEHEIFEVVIDRLAGQRATDELHAILRVARDLFEHHARDEEEGSVFPHLEQLVGSTQRATLGHDLILERERITPAIERATSPRDVIPVRRLHAHKWH